MRLALILALIHGFVPGLGEVAETAVHYAVAGHLAHTDADHGDLHGLGDEHGCGGAEHLCGCCASQAFMAQPVTTAAGASAPRASLAIEDRQLASLHEPAPPRRPPIAS